MTNIRPSHGLFIKWGRFQIGAFGRPAVLTVLVAVVAAFLSRLWGLW
jgi:hypothetical protein